MSVVIKILVHQSHLLLLICFHDVCEYIQSTHWLDPGYYPGQIAYLEKSMMMTTPYLSIKDSSLAR